MSTPPTRLEPGSTTPTTKTPSAVTKAVSVATKIPPGNCFKGIVTVDVGPEGTSFMVHRDLLVFYSDYFRGAFNSSFKEAVECKLKLPDERVDVFSIFNKFIYTRQLFDEDVDPTWQLLIEVWLFGDKHIVPALQNEVMDTLIAKNAKLNLIPAAELQTIYDNTLHSSPLLRIVVDWVTYKSEMQRSLKSEKTDFHWPHEALVDLAIGLGSKKAEKLGGYVMPAENLARCYYHVHNEGESCP
ncbi:hypothetical protein D6D19_10466 [Aureobasidium pullulans]|uniref:BTB domain-containing protein n=1 Tax=Aureobasidium pullulans TaxID=5580 RepID=A0A4S8YYI6_AURPU|nr:hypothetical protein D6D19_10466 [Aureobasidium pullulans]